MTLWLPPILQQRFRDHHSCPTQQQADLASADDLVRPTRLARAHHVVLPVEDHPGDRLLADVRRAVAVPGPSSLRTHPKEPALR